MSLADAIAQLNSLAPKAAGHLIRPQDWNALISALTEYGAVLTTHDSELSEVQTQIAAIVPQLAALTARVDAVDARLTDLEEQVTPLLTSYRVSLASERSTYASGQLCELIATVTDLRGQPLPGPAFPWVDFVSSWGRLRARAGWNSRAGTGDNSLSVQVNAQGIARVQLRAEHSEGFSELEEQQISAIMQVQVPSQNSSVADVLLAAPAPSDARAQSAYQVIHAEYERQDSIAMRMYADTYQVRTREWGVQELVPNLWQQWRDQRSTVLAFAKPDADPLTPDGARGSASIQVTFRDWLWPWAWNYLGNIDELVIDVTEHLRPYFDRDDVLDKFIEDVDTRYGKLGLIGRTKYIEAVKQSVERMQLGNDPKRQGAKDQVLQALTAQQSTGYTGAMAPGLFSTYLEQGKLTGKAQTRIDGVQGQVDGFKQLEASVNVIEGRMQSVEKQGQQIQTGLTSINENVRAINPLDDASIKANVQKIGVEIAALRNMIG